MVVRGQELGLEQATEQEGEPLLEQKRAMELREQQEQEQRKPFK